MSEANGMESARGMRAASTAHPIISGVIVTCTLIGAVSRVYLLTGEWSIARRLAAAVVAGVGVGIAITAPRIIG